MKYRPTLRPASHSTLPAGLDWSYVEAPHYLQKRPDLPRSRYYHGVIECRELTKDELVRFDLEAITTAPAEQRK
jgi:hypothetical protein